ncbi:MAG: hypothetical protein Q8R53_02765 [Nanoarchaeota archaeon]|nr:hypothetical protein [Nanoarchaeota archaeon]
MATIADRVFGLAVQQFGMKRNSLSRTTDLDSLARNPEDFGWFIRALEREWGISIPEKEQLALDTLGDLISCVYEKVQTKNDGRGNQPPNHQIAV